MGVDVGGWGRSSQMGQPIDQRLSMSAVGFAQNDMTLIDEQPPTDRLGTDITGVLQTGR